MNKHFNKIIKNKILKKHCDKISEESKLEGIGIDTYSKEFNLLNHLLILVMGIINKKDLTDMSYKKISKSQLSKLNNNRSYSIFEKVFYSLLNTFIKAHRYDVYHDELDKLYSIMAIDSTFIETIVKGSGIYQREKKRNGIKVHIAAKTGNYALPLKAIITPANVNDSKVFDDLLWHINEYISSNTVLTFDLGYYSYGRFKELKEKGINFVSRIKKNADYTVIKEETFNSKIVRFKNGSELRLVSGD